MTAGRISLNLTPGISLSDRRWHRHFTLSYKRLLYPPDVLLDESVIPYMRASAL
jgi:hypothetical protein